MVGRHFSWKLCTVGGARDRRSDAAALFLGFMRLGVFGLL